MKGPGQPNWGQQQQRRMQQQMRQQQQRRAAGYAWQKQQQQKKQAARMRAGQGIGQPGQGLDLGDLNRAAPMPTYQAPRRSCLGTLVRIVVIVLAIGACLVIAAIILGNL